MSMSKKDFIALADVIKEHGAATDSQCQVRITDTAFTKDQITTLADFCASQNPRFNRARWLDYIAGKCGPSGGAVKEGKRASHGNLIKARGTYESTHCHRTAMVQ